MRSSNLNLVNDDVCSNVNFHPYQYLANTFEREMLITNLSTTTLHIFYKSMFYSYVISKFAQLKGDSFKGPLLVKMS